MSLPYSDLLLIESGKGPVVGIECVVEPHLWLGSWKSSSLITLLSNDTTSWVALLVVEFA